VNDTSQHRVARWRVETFPSARKAKASATAQNNGILSPPKRASFDQWIAMLSAYPDQPGQSGIAVSTSTLDKSCQLNRSMQYHLL